MSRLTNNNISRISSNGSRIGGFNNSRVTSNGSRIGGFNNSRVNTTDYMNSTYMNNNHDNSRINTTDYMNSTVSRSWDHLLNDSRISNQTSNQTLSRVSDQGVRERYPIYLRRRQNDSQGNTTMASDITDESEYYNRLNPRNQNRYLNMMLEFGNGGRDRTNTSSFAPDQTISTFANRSQIIDRDRFNLRNQSYLVNQSRDNWNNRNRSILDMSGSSILSDNSLPQLKKNDKPKMKDRDWNHNPFYRPATEAQKRRQRAELAEYQQLINEQRKKEIDYTFFRPATEAQKRRQRAEIAEYEQLIYGNRKYEDDSDEEIKWYKFPDTPGGIRWNDPPKVQKKRIKFE